MKKKTKTKKYNRIAALKSLGKRKLIIFPVLACLLLIMPAVFIYYADNSGGSSKKMSLGLDSFGKYSGTDDNKDGIALSACYASQYNTCSASTSGWCNAGYCLDCDSVADVDSNLSPTAATHTLPLVQRRKLICANLCCSNSSWCNNKGYPTLGGSQCWDTYDGWDTSCGTPAGSCTWSSSTDGVCSATCGPGVITYHWTAPEVGCDPRDTYTDCNLGACACAAYSCSPVTCLSTDCNVSRQQTCKCSSTGAIAAQSNCNGGAECPNDTCNDGCPPTTGNNNGWKEVAP